MDGYSIRLSPFLLCRLCTWVAFSCLKHCLESSFFFIDIKILALFLMIGKLVGLLLKSYWFVQSVLLVLVGVKRKLRRISGTSNDICTMEEARNLGIYYVSKFLLDSGGSFSLTWMHHPLFACGDPLLIPSFICGILLSVHTTLSHELSVAIFNWMLSWARDRGRELSVWWSSPVADTATGVLQAHITERQGSSLEFTSPTGAVLASWRWR